MKEDFYFNARKPKIKIGKGSRKGKSRNMNKNKRNLMILLAALLLAGGLGYYFTQMNKPAENTVEETEPKPDEKKEEPDHSLINGYWKTETTEDGRFLEFTINYPEVTNFDGTKGTVKYDAATKGYIVTINHETGDTVVYLGDIDNNTGTIYYYENGEEDVKTLAANRDPDTAPDDVLANPTDSKPENSQNISSNTYSSSNTSANTGNNKPSSGVSSNSGGGTSNNSEKNGHYEERQVCVQEAYDEQVLVKKGECTSVCVQEAYDTTEEDYSNAYYNGDPVEVYVCNQCGEIITDWAAHQLLDGDHRGYHNEVRDTCDPYWHNVQYKTVHHDAVYETRCEPDEYKTVHHDAVYETQMVWVED